MKTLINKANPAIRITAPEIISEYTPDEELDNLVYWVLGVSELCGNFSGKNWALVDEEPEGWNKADCVKEIPFSLIYEEFAEHWRLGKAVEPGDYYIPISRLRWGIKGNLEEIPSNVDLEKEIDNYMDGYFSECQDGTLLNEGGSELQYEDVGKIAKYFYELGQCEMRNRITNPEYNKQVVDKMKSEHPIAANEEELKKAIKERYPMPKNADAHTRDRIAAARNGFLSGYSYELDRNAKKQ